LSDQAALQEALAHHHADRVGSSLCDGFCRPLLAQIAREIRAVFSGVFGEHPFATCWTYKNFQDKSGGHIHADNGAASLNLWITPDESNLETDTGGLVLWNKAVPDEYFDATGEEMMHKTLRLKFRDAHPHRRVRITFLYGKPGKSTT